MLLKRTSGYAADVDELPTDKWQTKSLGVRRVCLKKSRYNNFRIEGIAVK